MNIVAPHANTGRHLEFLVSWCPCTCSSNPDY